MSGRTAAAPRGPGEVTLEQLSVELDGRRILSDVTVHLDQHRIAVIGANGSGKSTFARVLNGLVAPTRGTARVLGYDVVRELRQLRREVGFVFTNPDAQILMPTVAEDVRLSLRGSGLDRAAIDARVAAVLAEYGLSEHADAPAYSLSGGQKQLLALASVLVREPSLVIADEPTTLLDLGNGRRIARHLIEELPAQLVVVTHDLELAARCDVALRFDEGRLSEVGEPVDVVARYRRDFS